MQSVKYMPVTALDLIGTVQFCYIKCLQGSEQLLTRPYLVEEICYHVVELDMNLYQSAWEHTTCIGYISVSTICTLLFLRAILVHIAQVRNF